MKITIDPLDKTYQLCTSTGSIKEKAADTKVLRIRTSGTFVYDDWKSLKLEFELHIKALKKEIELKLKEV